MEVRGLKFTHKSIRLMGGEGSGHHGHTGRPGSVGGSASGEGTTDISQIENELGSAKTEFLVALTPDGEEFYRVSGTSGEISPDRVDVQAIRGKRAIIIHNHPPGVAGMGEGISAGDIAGLYSLDPKEFRVVQTSGDKMYVSVLQRGSYGWPTPKQVKSQFNRTFNKVSSEFAGPMTGEGIRELHHNFLGALAPKLGISYTRIVREIPK